ncbi:MAG: bifunctional diaminohydroxyphosphoribosylaminopyrimidine deaminase/5-amino-6-(5-phosphoribosylamino)uracil reductase RibD [Panacagrimonas sp.]
MSESASAHFMARALRLAERGRTTTFPNPRVGCVVVRNGEVVGEGWHQRAGEPHAEVHALRAAGEQARGAELFVNLEPCSHFGRTPPCADALIGAGVRRVWTAMPDPNPQVSGQGIARLRAAGIDVEVGLLHATARELNRGFVSRMERGRPYLTLKLAASLDGRTAMASGESKWITSEAARADAHRLRAEAGAVLTSSATVLADDPELTVRTGEAVERQPDRIVLDCRTRVPAGARVWRPDGARRWSVVGGGAGGCASLIHPTARSRVGKRSASTSPAREPTRLEIASHPAGLLHLPAVLAELARCEINSVLVECGPTLAGALLRESLVDELVVYLAPSLLGSEARGLAGIPGLERLAERIELRFTEVRAIGPDLRITAVPLNGAS